MSNKYKKGEFLSRTSYMLVTGSDNTGLTVKNQKNLEWAIATNIVENECISASQFSKEEKKSKTEICEILESTKGTVFTVNYNKQVDKDKLKETLENLYPNKGKIISKDDFDKNVKSILKSVETGEERTLVGYLKSTKTLFGRYQVIDLEVNFDPSIDNNGDRQVDSKTINWLIFNDVKYIVK